MLPTVYKYTISRMDGYRYSPYEYWSVPVDGSELTKRAKTTREERRRKGKGGGRKEGKREGNGYSYMRKR